jgi:hypothetical protein
VCTSFYLNPTAALIGYDRADGMVFVGVSAPASVGNLPAGQTARLSVFVGGDTRPVVSAETTVDAELKGSFRFPYCSLLPYRELALRLVVTVERSDGEEYARGEGRPRLTCAPVEPPAECASLCAE